MQLAFWVDLLETLFWDLKSGKRSRSEKGKILRPLVPSLGIRCKFWESAPSPRIYASLCFALGWGGGVQLASGRNCSRGDVCSCKSQPVTVLIHIFTQLDKKVKVQLVCNRGYVCGAKRQLDFASFSLYKLQGIAAPVRNWTCVGEYKSVQLAMWRKCIRGDVCNVDSWIFLWPSLRSTSTYLHGYQQGYHRGIYCLLKISHFLDFLVTTRLDLKQKKVDKER